MGGVAQVSEVVDVAEELVVQLREVDHRYGAVLVEGPGVALQPGAEVSDVGGDLLDHHPPEGGGGGSQFTTASKNHKCPCTPPFKADLFELEHSYGPHLAAPNGFGCVELSEEYLGDALGLVVLQVADHGFRQHRTQNAALHYVLTLSLGGGATADGFTFQQASQGMRPAGVHKGRIVFTSSDLKACFRCVYFRNLKRNHKVSEANTDTLKLAIREFILHSFTRHNIIKFFSSGPNPINAKRMSR